MKVKYPKARSVGWSILFWVALTTVGCRSCMERYEPFLKNTQDNLETEVLPKYEKALKQSDRDPDLIDNDVGLLKDTIASIKRVRGAGPEVWKPQEGNP